MKYRYYALLWCAVIIMCAVDCGALFRHTKEPDITGLWRGRVIAATGREQLGIMNVFKKPDGTLGATLDSRDGGIKGLEIDEITLEKNILRFTIQPIGGIFQGTVTDNDSLIEGEWLINNEKFRVILRKEQ